MNLKSLLRYYHTIRHLKGRQIAYQLKYRLRKIKPENFHPVELQIRRLIFDDFNLIPSTGKFYHPCTFTFLNRSKTFNAQPEWNDVEFGKLWNYNLQYFDYLHDPELSTEDAKELIESCSHAIISGTLPLESYPVSLRLTNWLLYHSKTGYTSDVFEKAVSIQYSYLRANPEYHIEANHLLENYIALFICSLYTDRQSSKQLSERLLREIDRQLLDDGAHYECSPMYHCVILSKLCIVYSILKKNNLQEDVAIRLNALLVKMFGWLSAFQYTNGTYAFFNDAAPGVAPDTNVLYAFVKKYNLAFAPVQLRESGYRKLNAAFGEVVVDIGNILPPFQPGHAHSDMLSFTVFGNGKEWLIDPGVSTYEKTDRRQLERSTRCHNTVTIEDEDQSDVWGGFRVGRRANISVEVDGEEQIVASHDGYLSRYGCVHKRSFKAGDVLEIWDQLIWKKGERKTGTARFFIDGLTERVDASKFVVDQTMEISFQNFTRSSLADIDIPDGFNRHRSAQLLSVEFQDHLTTTIRFY